MRAADLRGWLAEQLKTERVPDAVWDLLEEDLYVAEALDPAYPDGRAALVRQARRLLRVRADSAGRGRRRGRPATAPSPPSLGVEVLTDDERLRALALSEYTATVAAALPAVRRFRVEVLGGRLLPPSEARAFLHSPAVRFFSRSQLHEWGVPLAVHVPQLLRDSQEERADLSDGGATLVQRVAVRIDPPGTTHEGEEAVGVRMGDRGPTVIHGPQRLEVHDEGTGAAKPVTYFRGSLLDELALLAGGLWSRYFWPEAEAAVFVLSGRPPLALPIRVKAQRRESPDFWHTTISVEAAPWVSEDTLRKVYRVEQRRVLGGDNRPLSPRNLALFRFITARVDDAGSMPSWRALCDEWNRAHPESESRYHDVRRLARDYRRAERALLWPDHQLPG